MGSVRFDVESTGASTDVSSLNKCEVVDAANNPPTAVLRKVRRLLCTTESLEMRSIGESIGGIFRGELSTDASRDEFTGSAIMCWHGIGLRRISKRLGRL
jgi:hypothetical protein